MKLKTMQEELMYYQHGRSSSTSLMEQTQLLQHPLPTLWVIMGNSLCHPAAPTPEFLVSSQVRPSA